MYFNDATDFYEVFDKFPEAFAKANTFAEFCALAAPQLATYSWAPAVFATAKAGKRTYRSLRFPNAAKFADLFAEAKFLPTPTGGAKPHSVIPPGFYFLSGNSADNAVPCRHVGGTRSWSETMPDVRSHYGAKFYGTYVKPGPELAQRLGDLALVAPLSSFEAVTRDDGILIIARDTHSIGSDWLALLDRDATIEDMFDADTKLLLALDREDERRAWPEVKTA